MPSFMNRRLAIQGGVVFLAAVGFTNAEHQQRSGRLSGVSSLIGDVRSETKCETSCYLVSIRRTLGQTRRIPAMFRPSGFAKIDNHLSLDWPCIAALTGLLAEAVSISKGSMLEGGFGPSFAVHCEAAIGLIVP